MIELLINIAGWAGSFLLILAYYLNSKNWFTAQSFWYQMANLVGSLLLIVNTIYFGAYPSAFVNIVWVFIGFYYLIQIKTNKNETQVH